MLRQRNCALENQSTVDERERNGEGGEEELCSGKPEHSCIRIRVNSVKRPFFSHVQRELKCVGVYLATTLVNTIRAEIISIVIHQPSTPTCFGIQSTSFFVLHPPRRVLVPKTRFSLVFHSDVFWFPVFCISRVVKNASRIRKQLLHT